MYTFLGGWGEVGRLVKWGASIKERKMVRGILIRTMWFDCIFSHSSSCVCCQSEPWVCENCQYQFLRVRGRVALSSPSTHYGIYFRNSNTSSHS